MRSAHVTAQQNVARWSCWVELSVGCVDERKKDGVGRIFIGAEARKKLVRIGDRAWQAKRPLRRSWFNSVFGDGIIWCLLSILHIVITLFNRVNGRVLTISSSAANFPAIQQHHARIHALQYVTWQECRAPLPTLRRYSVLSQRPQN